MWEDEDIVGKRKLQKQRCLHMQWSNAKEITAWELAYCIHEHGIDINMIPESRLKRVSEELAKLKQEQEPMLIKTVLADSALNPDLFHTLVEAEFALSELSSYWNQEMIKIEEYDHTYKDNNHSRDDKRLQESFKKVRQQYVALGGIGADFDKLVASLPKPNKRTLKQDVNDKRSDIEVLFTSIGVSPTRAKKIAIAITTQLYMAL